ncbi:hypothetical protein [Wansuia hejianensis]|uniref:Glutaredoxin domain-containing protein n=1 Tax=Wansuia hejianensis TaxID=2763667 RepID=A0A926ILJ1_9FIRM|nr:hypothetical protein [Wansuia hejianensis]MBC8589606.1 hypothetical protein [Wansuia hejianensis]
MKEFLSENNIEFNYVDITESMFNLKRFLKYRDNNEVFDNIRRKNMVGIPVVMINNGQKFFFKVEEEDLDELR